MTFFAIVLAEDHAGFRRLIRLELESAGDVQVVGEVDDGEELLNLLEQISPDLVILDISMPRMSGLEAAKRIQNSHPQIKILILTMHKNPAYLREAEKLGVSGYLLKEEMDETLLTAIRQIRAGHTYISPLLAEAGANFPHA